MIKNIVLLVTDLVYFFWSYFLEAKKDGTIGGTLVQCTNHIVALAKGLEWTLKQPWHQPC